MSACGNARLEATRGGVPARGHSRVSLQDHVPSAPASKRKMAGVGNHEEAQIKARIKAIYTKLEDLTFKASFEDRVAMKQCRLKVPRYRPVYLVKDIQASKMLDEIYSVMKKLEKTFGGIEIWKGITMTGGTCKLWGTEESVDHSISGLYHVPVGGIEVIVNRSANYLAIVNITVKGQRKRLSVSLLVDLIV